jgi:hypothetical protein
VFETWTKFGWCFKPRLNFVCCRLNFVLESHHQLRLAQTDSAFHKPRHLALSGCRCRCRCRCRGPLAGHKHKHKHKHRHGTAHGGPGPRPSALGCCTSSASASGEWGAALMCTAGQIDGRWQMGTRALCALYGACLVLVLVHVDRAAISRVAPTSASGGCGHLRTPLRSPPALCVCCCCC